MKIIRYILDAKGKPVPAANREQFRRWMSKNKNRLLRQDKVGNGVSVSTVFLALDLGSGPGKPALWETMIFGGRHDGYQERYSSQSEALNGHLAAMAIALQGLGAKKQQIGAVVLPVLLEEHKKQHAVNMMLHNTELKRLKAVAAQAESRLQKLKARGPKRSSGTN